jgi:hypothetical protein
MNRGGLSPVLFSLQSPEPTIGNKRRKNDSLLSSICKTLHKGWSRPQSTMATLIRTEHIGLRAYLTRQRVPDITPECTCGYRTQTLKHIMLFCPERQESRRRLTQTVGSDWKTITQTRRGLNAATRWMIQESVLDRFSLAREEEEERERKGEGD